MVDGDVKDDEWLEIMIKIITGIPLLTIEISARTMMIMARVTV